MHSLRRSYSRRRLSMFAVLQLISEKLDGFLKNFGREMTL